MDHDSHESTTVRRRRKVGRSLREKTPDPNSRRKYSDDESSQLGVGTTTSEDANAQTIHMQIRPPGTMSAHESKILRRRDKTFASTAARSHSQPREAERLSNPEADDLLRTVKRSLSSPRHKEESSESELTATAGQRHQLSPTVDERELRHSSSQRKMTDFDLPSTATAADENLSRLDQNLRRFEEERKRFEAEKRHFEREKHEHKLRYKQMHDNEERKRLLQSYRKLSDRIQLPTDAEERRRMVHSLRLQRNDAPQVRLRNRHSGYDESSTQFSSSECDGDEASAKRLAKQLSPVRRHASVMATTNQSHAATVAVGGRGPPPKPPPPVPERRSVSRNNSLSPIRPQRRSKTPEQRAEIMRKLTETTGENEPQVAKNTDQHKRETTATPATTEVDSEIEALRRRRSVRREEMKRDELKRRQSLEHTSAKAEVKVTQEAEPAQPKLELEAKLESEVQSQVEQTKPLTFLQKLMSIFQRSSQSKAKPIEIEANDQESPSTLPQSEKLLTRAFLRQSFMEARQQWKRLKSDCPHEMQECVRLRNKCIAHTIILILLCGFGGLMFRYTEGTAENIYKCEVRKVKRDFIDNLWTVSHNMREDDWKSLARQKLRKFEEELHALQELGTRRYPGMKSWNFVNCIIYCWTVITTIGYGHITPKTTLGQSLTIIYAIIGIPMFLILLADFGKLFTRSVKVLWAYVRRLYYTGTCRQIRKQQQVRDAMSGFNTVYDTIRRPSQFFGMGPEADVESQESEVGRSIGASHPDTPTSPYPETIIIDDEFNLPVSVASVLLILYILIGTFAYTKLEDWTIFEAFYFVFISMSTIGFGDYVPNHPIFMTCSIVYLIFGLALTSMFINVVQIKLSDTFKQASAKIGATIGFGMASELGDEAGSHIKTPSDLASVHGSRLGKIAEDEIEMASSPSQLTSILRQPRPVSPSLNASYDENGSDLEQGPPPLMPRRQVSMDQQPSAEVEQKKKKKRFFK